MKNSQKILTCFISLLVGWHAAISQQKDSTRLPYITVPAGAEYKTSSFHQWLWGKNYRREWVTPVRFPVALLDTLNGGLTPTKGGGGHQTKSLHSEDRTGKKYTLRSVNKTLGKVLPEDFLGTFLEDIVDDKVSMSHPYGAAAAAYLAKSAGNFHTIPTFVYLPRQPALDSFDQFGNEVYLFEQKIDGNWKEADNLGNFEDYISTFKVLDKMYSDNSYQVDQEMYIRSRLFDMLINDWDRHEDQWEWGAAKVGDQTIFRAVPQDRDQAFFKYDGVLLSFLLSASGMKYFQPFGAEMRDVTTFNYEQRNLDRFFTNKMSLGNWQEMAKKLQQSLPDKVIEASVKQMPVEVHGLSGDLIVASLKGRRDRMVEYATTYYNFIAKEVDVIGSNSSEHFIVKKLNSDETAVSIYAVNNGVQHSQPFYTRTFKSKETSEVRLYGLGGNDTYTAEGDANKMTVRLIGGRDKDTINSTASHVQVYDNKDNIFSAGSTANYHLKDDTSIHEFKYASYLYDKRGIKPVFLFSNEDWFYVGMGYGIKKHEWRKEPFAYSHDIGVNYSITQKALSVFYKGIYPRLIGNWDLALTANWDAIRWTNFFGFGNETRFIENNIRYYRARTEEWLGQVGLNRKFGYNDIRVNAFYKSIRVINDADRFTGKNLGGFVPGLFNTKYFGGGEILYNVHVLNDSVVPTRGIAFFGRAAYLQNLNNTSRTVGDYQGHVRVYLPVISKFSLELRAGAQTITGKPEFYQLAPIGGGQNVRGFRSTRFWGKTAFYNSNELRFINNVKSYLYNGKFGLVAFFDNGRVWLPGEQSNTWHTGYGGGILLAPFNKILAEVTYGISDEEKLIQFRITVPIPRNR